jgi:N-acetylglucosaminyldiphosphoundecaprenol N-acetyl-beta-D-mannosaminyltransferase
LSHSAASNFPHEQLPFKKTLKRIPIIGLPVAATHYAGAVEWILEHASKADRAYAVEAANTHVAALARADQAFGESMRQFDLICPDGMPLVWALNSQLPASEKLTDRVYGPTLMLETLKATSQTSSPYKHFLLGGKQSTLDKLSQSFAEQFPGVTLVGMHSPPFGEWPEDEFDTIVAKIKDSGANLIWVGLGCPKQEHWIAAHKHRLPPGVYFGIGAAFAFHAGEVKQSPPIFQRYGLEWAYRLAMEPRRLFKRYFTYNSLFVFHLIRDHIRS